MPGTILITGCSSGIGAYCARALRTEGWRVFATARKPDDIAQLKAEGFEAFFLEHSDAASMTACLDAVLAATGGTLDALFLNGAYSQAGAVEDVSTDAIRAQFEVNVFGWHALAKAVVPVMRRQGHGRIIANSSILGRVPLRFRGPYAASKFALEGLMLCLRLELEGSGIHVSLIEPGPVTSRIATNALAHFKANIDAENSVHKADYAAQIARLEQGGSKSAFKQGPEIVMPALRHALEAVRPKAHYPVTPQARISLWLQWLLPQQIFYRLLARRS
jgi:NAD(P)-dependent dehydrogenase (short-subunit alcohol dehydrogenase family)